MDWQLVKQAQDGSLNLQ